MKIIKSEVNTVRHDQTRGLKNRHLGRIYWWFENETILEHLVNRHSEPYKVIKPLVKQWLTENGYTFTKLSFSRKAGCGMCPCSPGFIVEGCLPYHSVHLTLRFEEADAAIEETQVETLKPVI
jgi:hypothetical protein